MKTSRRAYAHGRRDLEASDALTGTAPAPRAANDAGAQVPAVIPPTMALEPSPKPPKLRAWFRRIFGGRWVPQGERIEIRVANLVDDVERIHSRHVFAALDKRAGFKVRPLNQTMELELIGDPVTNLAKAAGAAREWLARAGADLLIWGEATQPGTTLTLRFAPAVAEDEDRPGYFGPAARLNLPANFGPEFEHILFATCVAATLPLTESKRQQLIEALPRALNQALPVYQEMPPDLTGGERAAVQVCIGNIAANVAVIKGADELNQVAAQAYRAALEATNKDEEPMEWATIQRNLGVVLQAMAEINDDTETFDAAASAYRAAMSVLTKEQLPRQWAATQNRLGLIYHKLDLKTGDTEMVKHALSAFQAALQVFTRKESPEHWADVMTNFAQAAQMLGGQLRNPEVLKTAADACHAVLEVRDREAAPMQWAAVQNNLGSALFLLGKELRGDTEHLEGAIKAFAEARDVYQEVGAGKLATITEKNMARAELLYGKRGGGSLPKMDWEGEEEDREKESE